MTFCCFPSFLFTSCCISYAYIRESLCNLYLKEIKADLSRSYGHHFLGTVFKSAAVKRTRKGRGSSWGVPKYRRQLIECGLALETTRIRKFVDSGFGVAKLEAAVQEVSDKIETKLKCRSFMDVFAILDMLCLCLMRWKIESLFGGTCSFMQY